MMMMMMGYNMKKIEAFAFHGNEMRGFCSLCWFMVFAYVEAEWLFTGL
jgi:hypothetical protein